MTPRACWRARKRETLTLYFAERDLRTLLIAKIAARGFETCKRVVPAA